MEILAPAGNRAALERADAAGADAVYLGYSAFSARAGAGNFDREQLEEAIRYAHLRHMRVYVTVNTLVKDAEVKAVTEVLRLMRDLHADGVLVQDLGVLRIARSLFPDLPLHASTQMAIHCRTGVRWCGKQGIRRVVLARECPLAEIRRCREETPGIEVFVHGAQCVAVSGLCLFSSMVGERSGNRGRCAQPCRTEYVYRGVPGAWLSPRDLCLRDELPALSEAGVESLKIEGRLKRPEYVAAVTECYRRAMDSLAAGRFLPAEAEEKEALLQIFNRGGFMKGYAFGAEDAAVIEPGTVSHQGVMLAKVAGMEGPLCRVLLQRTLRDGDGLAIRGGKRTAELVYAGPERKAGETALLRLRPGDRAERGDAVFRLTDAEQMRRADHLPGRRVPVSMRLRAMAGEPLTLTMSDGTHAVTRTGETVQQARTRAAEAAELERNLRKTGNTVFTVREMQTETKDAFVPVSALNALRRETLEALAEKRIGSFVPDTEREGLFPEEHLPAGRAPDTAEVRTEPQAEAVRAAGLRLIWHPEDYREAALRPLLARMKQGEWLRLPDVCEEETLLKLNALVTEYRDRLGGVLLGTCGQLGLEWPVPFGASESIPVMNRQTASLLFEEGCAFVTASPELTGAELKTLTAGGAPIVVTLYGRTRLMLLHHCPARTALGLRSGRRNCDLCDRGAKEALKGTALEDRRGHRFPLLRERLPEGCLVQLLNALPTDNLDRQAACRGLQFTTESGEETEQVIRAFLQKQKTAGETTTGHWRRPVE